MITYRQRGLANLHSVIVAGAITLLLPAYAEMLPLVPRIALGDGISLMPYGAAVFLAMLLSADQIHRRNTNLHALGIWDAFALAGRQMFIVGAAVFTVVFVLKDQGISRLYLGSYLLLAFFLLAWLHAHLPEALARLLFPAKTKLPTVLVGRGESLDDLDDWIARRGHLGIVAVGFLTDEIELSRGESAVAPSLGHIDRLPEVLREHQVAQVILLDWTLPNERIEWIVERCEQEGVRFLVHNNYAARFAREMLPVEEGGRHFLTLQSEPLEDPVNRALKRAFDIAVSLPVCLFILPPLALLVWIMQRAQAPGPVCFNRPRGGQGRRSFRMFKFRSMYAKDHDITKQATAGDSRVFPFGRIMRKTSIDEFPQFLNVLRGEMSVVGPRPHLPEHDDQFAKITRTYHGRSFVKPGITGLAQVRGYRGEITEEHKLHRRVYWDLYYVSRWSLWLDVRIVVLTAWQVIFPPKTAY